MEIIIIVKESLKKLQMFYENFYIMYFSSYNHTYGGIPQKTVLIKDCVFNCSTPIKMFFPLLKMFLNSCILMPFSASAVFCFTSSTSAKCFPLRTFSIWETNKKVAGGEIRWTDRVGHWGQVMPFLVTNCWTLSGVWAGVLAWNGQMCWKSLPKKFTKTEHRLSQHHQLVRWYRWVPRTLT